ncbi:MAG: flagellar hook-associated protein FlgL [Myxococcota bacterium]
MRVSDSMVRSFVTQANQQANSNFLEISQRIASGRSVSTPSDDPVKAARIVRLDRMLGRLESMGNVRNQVTADLNQADAALTRSSDVLGDLNALALQAASGAPTSADFQAFAQEARGDLAALVNLANTRTDDGRYVFGGTREGEAPYDAQGNLVGGGGARRVEVAPGVFIESTVTPAESFGADDEVFGAVRDLITALENEDQDAIRDASEGLDGAVETVLVNAAGVGSRISQIEDTSSLAEDMGLQLSLQKGEAEEIDLVAEVSRLRAAESTLTAVSQVTQRLLNTSIASFLG